VSSSWRIYDEFILLLWCSVFLYCSQHTNQKNLCPWIIILCSVPFLLPVCISFSLALLDSSHLSAFLTFLFALLSFFFWSCGHNKFHFYALLISLTKNFFLSTRHCMTIFFGTRNVNYVKSRMTWLWNSPLSTYSRINKCLLFNAHVLWGFASYWTQHDMEFF